MSPELQTIAALVIVGLTTLWFVVRSVGRRRQSGCGDNCGAVNREVKDLQARLRAK